MDQNSLIDRKTFEVFKHAEDYPKAFICDKRIAPAIAVLNKKGYITKASCGGHYNGGCDEQFNISIDLLEEAKRDSQYFIKEIRDDCFDCYVENRYSYIYVLFEHRHNFETVPSGFELVQNEEDPRMISKGSSLECIVDYFDEQNHKKHQIEIEKEMDKYCEILKNWAENLPDIN